MRTKMCIPDRQSGLSLIELVVFIVIVSIALVTLLQVFNSSVTQSLDPAIRLKTIERAQALMDEILVRKFDENTPTGGIPACIPLTDCAGISTPDSDFDDVGDYNGYTAPSEPLFTLTVVVEEAGLEIGLASDGLARRITVTSTAPDGYTVVLSSYKANF